MPDEFRFGLNLSQPDITTEEEKEAFRQAFATNTGRSHIGLNFLTETMPDVSKRYRRWSNFISQPDHDGMKLYNPNGFGFVYLYGMTGWVEGVGYIIYVEQSHGLTKAEVLEGVAAAFFYLGPRGIETVANALEDFEWRESEHRPPYPENWDVDPEAFKSGIDFTSPDFGPGELELVRDWYMRVEGEVPGYVEFLAENRPEMLKMWRNRFENTMRKLPKQVMPYMMIHINVMRGFREGIRESVLLARGFGMTKAQTAEAIQWGMFYGGVESGSLAQSAVGDILRDWKT